jgi:hypothetical protein
MADAEGLEQEADATALGEPQFTEPQEAEAAQQFVQQIPEGQAPDQTEMYQQQLDPQQQGPFSQIEGGEGSEQPAAEPPIAVAPEAAPAPAAAPPAAGQTVVPVVYEEEFEVEQIVTERILEVRLPFCALFHRRDAANCCVGAFRATVVVQTSFKA